MKKSFVIQFTIFGIFLFIHHVGFAQNTVNTVPPEAEKLVNPLKNNADATKEGAKLFQQYCVACHGKKGKGDGPAGISLNPRPANFLSTTIKEETDGALFWKISNGVAHSAMPTWKNNLTDHQRWALVNFIRELQRK